MSSLEVMMNDIVERFPNQSSLEVKITHIRERPEYGDKIVSRTYTLTVDMATVYDESFEVEE